jgi:mono/diheme cytochrome c family protein
MKLAGIALIACASLAGCSMNEPQNEPQKDVRNLPGLQMYEQLCSSCHGVGGKGDGPVSLLIKTGVPDLTRLAGRHGGEFPTEDVRRVIDGRWDKRAHGARDMPVWGWQFYNSTNPKDAEERARVDAIISRLMDYLRSIQVEGS